MERMRMCHVWLLALAALGCDPGSELDAGAPAADGSIDAGAGGMDAGALWERVGCSRSARRPEIGVDSFCPAVHDWVGFYANNDASVPGDAGCNDAGPDAAWPDHLDAGPEAGVYCAPWTDGWVAVRACRAWVYCPNEGTADPCFHCLDYGANPGALDL